MERLTRSQGRHFRSSDLHRLIWQLYHDRLSISSLPGNSSKCFFFSFTLLADIKTCAAGTSKQTNLGHLYIILSYKNRTYNLIQRHENEIKVYHAIFRYTSGQLCLVLKPWPSIKNKILLFFFSLKSKYGFSKTKG